MEPTSSSEPANSSAPPKKNPPPKSSSAPPDNRKRNRWLISITIFFLICGIAWVLYWIFFGRFYATTDDAMSMATV